VPLGTGSRARRRAAHTARRRGPSVLACGLAALGALGLTAAFLALTGISLIGALLAAGASCESGSEVTLPASDGTIVAATVYSGSGAGAYGAGLEGHYAFAELGLWSEEDTDRAHANRIGAALGLGGALAPYTRLEIQAPNGRVVVAEKRDIGMGGPPIDGHQRAIDLWTSTRVALGLPADWSGLVRVRVPADGSLATETAPPGTGLGPASSAACALGSVPGSEAAPRIVRVAQSQLGVRERPPGSNCTSYGPCEPWCALFVTWVWRRAGIPVPSLAFSGAIYAWAQRHGHVYSAGVVPRPGWAALFGSGPANPATSVHVGIVESVLPNDEITLINGNFDDSVMRTGPCHPADAPLPGARGCEEPGPVYAYAAPD
jgi:CHAP domain